MELTRLILLDVIAWIPTSFCPMDDDHGYYSPFENQSEMAEAYGRLDIRATWTTQSRTSRSQPSATTSWMTLLYYRYCATVGQMFRQTGGTTVPRLFGIEMTYKLGAY